MKTHPFAPDHQSDPRSGSGDAEEDPSLHLAKRVPFYLLPQRGRFVREIDLRLKNQMDNSPPRTPVIPRGDPLAGHFDCRCFRLLPPVGIAIRPRATLLSIILESVAFRFVMIGLNSAMPACRNGCPAARANHDRATPGRVTTMVLSIIAAIGQRTWDSITRSTSGCGFRCGSLFHAPHHPVRACQEFLGSTQQPALTPRLGTRSTPRCCARGFAAGPLIFSVIDQDGVRPSLWCPVSFCWPPSHSDGAATKMVIRYGAESFFHALCISWFPQRLLQYSSRRS